MGKSTFLQDFKAFAMKGNVIDMAVGVVTVSYTHLDVYKRQQYGRPPLILSFQKDLPEQQH